MTNIILCGFMGSGKTVVGKELAKIMIHKDLQNKWGSEVKELYEIALCKSEINKIEEYMKLLTFL